MLHIIFYSFFFHGAIGDCWCYHTVCFTASFIHSSCFPQLGSPKTLFSKSHFDHWLKRSFLLHSGRGVLPWQWTAETPDSEWSQTEEANSWTGLPPHWPSEHEQKRKGEVGVKLTPSQRHTHTHRNMKGTFGLFTHGRPQQRCLAWLHQCNTLL